MSKFTKKQIAGMCVSEDSDWRFHVGETFVNPYTFIPLGKLCERGNTETARGRLSGYMICELTTHTPLIIPNTTARQQDDKNKFYNFYSYEDLSPLKESENGNNAIGEVKNSDEKRYYKPIIPGSEIRGAIRSMYEAATNSCMGVVDTDALLYKRTTDSRTACGILLWNEQSGKWALYRATRFKVKIREWNEKIDRKSPDDSFPVLKDKVNSIPSGSRVDVKIESRLVKEGSNNSLNEKGKLKSCTMVSKLELHTGVVPGWVKNKGEYYLNRSGSIMTKRHESVFKREELIKEFEEDSNEITLLIKMLRTYVKEAERNKKNNEPIVQQAPLNNLRERKGAVCVFYYDHSEKQGKQEKQERREKQEEQDEHEYSFAPAVMSKEVFINTIKDLLEKNGGYQTCSNNKDLCRACSLFGMISKENSGEGINEGAMGSRVRFTDAMVDENSDNNYNCYDEKYYKERYYDEEIILNPLFSPKPSAVEFYLERPKEIEADIWNYDYALTSKNNKKHQIVKLRGRKFYWHGNSQKVNYTGKDFRCTVRPVSEGITFRFKVYFNRITEDELANLKWSLELYAENRNCMHKLGHAKPLGFGSVKIKVNKILVQSSNFDGNGSLQYLPYPAKEHNINKEILDKILKVTDFDFKDKDKVSYPKADARETYSKDNLIEKSHLGRKSDKGDQGGSSKEASYNWFIANRNIRVKQEPKGTIIRNTMNPPEILETLPEIEEEDQSLYKYCKHKECCTASKSHNMGEPIISKKNQYKH